MDKTLKYQNAILDLFQEYDKFWGRSGNLENRIVADKERHAFVFLTFGWQNAESYTHLLCFHLEIKDGKVWILENNTEALIANELIEKGVHPKDIVIGFVESPEMQQMAAA
jgi:hypothetical protein